MSTVLLPVKDFKDAKHRLGQTLSPGQRAGLSRAMLTDVLGALAGAARPRRVVVVTASEDVAAVAGPFGFEIVTEAVVRGHSAAVNAVIPELIADSGGVLSIAADLPWLESSHVDEALTTIGAPVTIFPSRDRTGTNGIRLTAALRFEVEYGPGSFKRHVGKSCAAGVVPTVRLLPGIAFDIDTPDDLRYFLEKPRLSSETWRFLSSAL